MKIFKIKPTSIKEITINLIQIIYEKNNKNQEFNCTMKIICKDMIIN